MTTLAIIIVSALFGISLCANIIIHASKNRLLGRIGKLREKIRMSDNERESAKVSYRMFTGASGACSVYRISYGVDGMPHYHTLIKSFDTDDAEYNRNEAIELIDNLEKTLCYD